jgi:hypothetical protein
MSDTVVYKRVLGSVRSGHIYWKLKIFHDGLKALADIELPSNIEKSAPKSFKASMRIAMFFANINSDEYPILAKHFNDVRYISGKRRKRLVSLFRPNSQYDRYALSMVMLSVPHIIGGYAHVSEIRDMIDGGVEPGMDTWNLLSEGCEVHTFQFTTDKGTYYQRINLLRLAPQWLSLVDGGRVWLEFGPYERRRNVDLIVDEDGSIWGMLDGGPFNRLWFGAPTVSQVCSTMNAYLGLQLTAMMRRIECTDDSISFDYPSMIICRCVCSYTANMPLLWKMLCSCNKDVSPFVYALKKNWVDFDTSANYKYLQSMMDAFTACPVFAYDDYDLPVHDKVSNLFDMAELY